VYGSTPAGGRAAGSRVIERGEDLHFMAKTRHALGVDCERGGQHFDGDLAAEPRFARYTSPIPPAPNNETIWYGPRRPVVKGIGVRGPIIARSVQEPLKDGGPTTTCRAAESASC